MDEEEELDNENFNVRELGKIIKEKIIKNICKFQFKSNKGEEQGTGFLCKIKFLNDSIMPVLISCHHLLSEVLSGQKNLIFYHFLKGIKKEENLEINENRITYENKKFDIVIIEIKEEDNLDIFDFLNIDNSVNIHNPQIKNHKVFILHYPKTLKEVHIAQGTITDINFEEIDNNGEYQYKSFIADYSSYPGSSGSPVINYENKYIVGLHKGGEHEGVNIVEATLINLYYLIFIIYLF